MAISGKIFYRLSASKAQLFLDSLLIFCNIFIILCMAQAHVTLVRFMKEVKCWPLSYKWNSVTLFYIAEVTTGPIFSPQMQVVAFTDFRRDLSHFDLVAFLGANSAQKTQQIRFSQ